MADLLAAGVPPVIVEIIGGDSLTMGQAAALRPAHRGDRTSASTAWRWAVAGAKDAAGNVVRLEVAKFGGRFLTSKAALARFAAALSGSAAEPNAPAEPARPKSRTTTQRAKAADAAAKRLAAAGA
jgi:hypothetical protein